jgi:hypothetical protein
VENKKAPSVSEEAVVAASPVLVGEADRHFSLSCPAPRSHVNKPHDKEGKKDEENEDEREIHDSIRLNSEYFFGRRVPPSIRSN